MKNIFKNKTILITGGCGSIGVEIVKQLLIYGPKEIKIFDNWETGFFNIGLNPEINLDNISNIIGDVRNKDELDQNLKDVDIVFHAAALKHVPFCELNPFAAVNTNVIGTQNLIQSCIKNNVKDLIYISTDKAINPINTMGATKLLGEKIITNSNLQNKDNRYSVVRFGNVLNSVGSVIPIFFKQIKKGGPLTITSKEMTRFFMSMEDAVSLVIKASILMNGGEIFILKMKSVRIIDLAEVLIEELAPKYGFLPKDIKIDIIGVRPGEKLHEGLISEEEALNCNDRGDLLVIENKREKTQLQRIIPDNYLSSNNEQKVKINYNSNDPDSLTKEQIKAMLYDKKII